MYFPPFSWGGFCMGYSLLGWALTLCPHFSEGWLANTRTSGVDVHAHGWIKYKGPTRTKLT